MLNKLVLMFLFALISLLTEATIIRADENYEARYQRALQIANKYAEKSKAAKDIFRSNYLETYQVGESWIVAAAQIDAALALNSMPQRIKEKEREVAIFKYRVKSIKSGTVIFEITQEKLFGFEPVDPNVEKIHLVLKDGEFIEKTYYFSRSGQRPLVVTSNSFLSKRTRLELFPLDFPSLIHSTRSKVDKVPNLPKSLKRIAEKAGVTSKNGNIDAFETEDDFGRSVTVLNETDQRWPIYIKSPRGVALRLTRADK